MELFQEQGFEDTSAVQIAERAGLTTRTFFRYFPDKEEVLFADEEVLRKALVAELRQADVAEPLLAVIRVLVGFDWEGLAPREFLRRREAMIASTPYLLERELIKQHQMADEFHSALRAHGVGAEVAKLAARVGVNVFREAYRHWLAADNDVDLARSTDKVVAVLRGLVPGAS
jgi:AcrR family transcriptional regulator